MSGRGGIRSFAKKEAEVKEEYPSAQDVDEMEGVERRRNKSKKVRVIVLGSNEQEKKKKEEREAEVEEEPADSVAVKRARPFDLEEALKKKKQAKVKEKASLLDKQIVDDVVRAVVDSEFFKCVNEVTGCEDLFDDEEFLGNLEEQGFKRLALTLEHYIREMPEDSDDAVQCSVRKGFADGLRKIADLFDKGIDASE